MLRIKIEIHNSFKIKLFYFEMEQRKTKIRPFKSPFFLLFNINKTLILLVFKEYIMLIILIIFLFYLNFC